MLGVLCVSPAGGALYADERDSRDGSAKDLGLIDD